MRIAAPFIAALAVAANAQGTSEFVDFPASAQQVSSPDGRYVAYNVTLDSNDSDGVTTHSIWIRKSDERTGIRVLGYNRHVSLLWSTDNASLLINDYEGSNHATCHLIKFTDGEEGILFEDKDLGVLLRDAVSIPLLANMVHQYVIATAWKSGHAITLSITGHAPIDGTTPNSIDFLCEYYAESNTFGQVIDIADIQVSLKEAKVGDQTCSTKGLR